MSWIVILAGGLILFWLTARSPSRANLGSSWAPAIVVALLGVLCLRLGRPILVVLPIAAWLVWSLARKSDGSENRARFDPGQARHDPARMTREQALRVLGLEHGASAEEIAAAHRKLVKKVHPDHGGTNFLAQQVNEAKRILESPED